MISLTVSAEHSQAIIGDGRDGEMHLRLNTVYMSANSPWGVPAYRYDVVVCGAKAGTISLRVSDDDQLVRIAGHIGFGIDERFRGRRLAGRAVRQLLPLADSHHLKPLWLGCNPDNFSSMKVMNWLGATYTETVNIPPDYERYYARGERQKRRYRLDF